MSYIPPGGCLKVMDAYKQYLCFLFLTLLNHLNHLLLSPRGKKLTLSPSSPALCFPQRHLCALPVHLN